MTNDHRQEVARVEESPPPIRLAEAVGTTLQSTRDDDVLEEILCDAGLESLTA